jgi:hypothetical protein
MVQNGTIAGYDDLKAACDKEFNASHVCTAHELGLIAQTIGLPRNDYRYVDMVPYRGVSCKKW